MTKLPDEKFYSLLEIENGLRGQGLKLIAGVDEAGRGPLAGPVVASAVIFYEIPPVLGIDDSKKLSKNQRRKIFDFLVSSSNVAIGIGTESEDAIDSKNIREASFDAMKKAVFSLPVKPDFVIVDGFAIPGLPIPQQNIIKGDSRSLSIAAASIIAKVLRDDMMDKYDIEFPDYGFSRHKGYGTKEHLECLRKFGPCRIHRKTFAPVRNYRDSGN
ncbi:MAG: ribonuclease HII [Candidatus Aureabacteria bacterium]|nr:ribonuclease HII [Candidatus Auribacterota bacterium]